MSDAYLNLGYVIYPITVFKSLSIVYGCSVTWSELTPDGTAIAVYAKLSTGDYVRIQNGVSFAELFADVDSATETLYIKVVLSTEDSTVTPIFSNLGVSFWDADRNIIYLRVAEGNTTSIQNAVGDVTVSYTSGTLEGLGGAVSPFELAFTPENLKVKNHPNDSEHIEISKVSAYATLTRVYYTSMYETERVEISNISATGVLISIDDI